MLLLLSSFLISSDYIVEANGSDIEALKLSLLFSSSSSTYELLSLYSRAFLLFNNESSKFAKNELCLDNSLYPIFDFYDFSNELIENSGPGLSSADEDSELGLTYIVNFCSLCFYVISLF